jgi:flagellar biosynthetic protein FliR
MLGLPDVSTAQAGQVLQQISGTTHDPLVILGTFLVVFARIAGFLVVAPFFGANNIPMIGRVAFAAMLSFVLTPLLYASAAPSLYSTGGRLGPNFLLLLTNQVLIGLVMGYAGQFMFYALDAAGQIIDTQRGANIGGLLNPASGQQSSATGQWISTLATAMLLITGQHLLLLQGLIDSFTLFRPTMSLSWLTHGTVWNKSAVVYQFAQMSSGLLLVTVEIAAPAMISLMLTDVLLGVINRGAPQVNVFVLSQLLKGPVGIGAVMVSLYALLKYLNGLEECWHACAKGNPGAVFSIYHLVHLMSG